ncbi:hypothetical protein B0A81_16505 [Flavobacterium plurextorum]|uniref:Uncharacterized protein n=1 Tax=Flavobacterium plurextorum TaxID=1114867 RepID=A0ABX4CSJ9_9FLAO|nr:hypothetical protein [Flavobacterium plurextorum]OXB04764.1 hypothetical protein B0A81_16505 [Flavobacterium plurextorum]
MDYFKQVEVRNALLKNAEKLNFILNCIDVVNFGMDGKMETLTTMFVPLDFLNAVVYPSISKPIEEIWDNIVVHDVEQAKDNGLRGIYELAKGKLFNEERYGNYECTKVNQEILNKILRREIKSLDNWQVLQREQKETMEHYEYEESLIYTVLHYSKTDEKIDRLITYIDTIFIN